MSDEDSNYSSPSNESLSHRSKRPKSKFEEFFEIIRASQTAFCKLCQHKKIEIKMKNRNTSGLRKHLISFHKKESEIFLPVKPKLSGDITSFLVTAGRSGQEEKNDDSDEDRTQEDPIEEDTFTEVVYLDEEPKHKRRHVFKRPKPNGNTSVQQAKPRIEYQVIPHEAKEEARPEIDSFLNYVGVLLKNVPKDSFPKLQLDVISLILNAQMAQPVTVPSTAVITVPTQVLSAINSTDYHITIGNKDDKNM